MAKNKSKKTSSQPKKKKPEEMLKQTPANSKKTSPKPSKKALNSSEKAAEELQNQKPIKAKKKPQKGTKTLSPNRWEIITDAENSFFVLFHDETEITRLEFTEATFSGIRIAINTYFPTEETEANIWRIQKPLTADEEDAENNPIMSLYRGNHLLAFAALPQNELKALVKALDRHIKKPSPIKVHISRWWKKHKILRVLVIIALVPIAAFLTGTAIWGLT